MIAGTICAGMLSHAKNFVFTIEAIGPLTMCVVRFNILIITIW